jgi:DNA-binding CsgD family transcriptional regulator
MGNGKWSAPTSDSAAARRAGGRRRYNAERQRAAEQRRREVAQLLFDGRAPGEIAVMLDVSPATISRDMAALRAEGERCPCCGALMNEPPALPDLLRRLAVYLAQRGDSVQNAPDCE